LKVLWINCDLIIHRRDAGLAKEIYRCLLCVLCAFAVNLILLPQRALASGSYQKRQVDIGGSILYLLLDLIFVNF
jgi:hypothetical protein